MLKGPEAPKTANTPTGSRPEVNFRASFQIKSDVFNEDIHIHELAHGIHLVGGPIIKGYSNALLKSYKWAMGAGTGLVGQYDSD